MSSFNKLFFVIFLIIFGLGIGVGVRFLENSFILNEVPGTAAPISPNTSIEGAKNTNAPVKEPEKEPPEISLLFVGDILLNRGVKSKIQNVGGGDFRFPFLNVASILKEADLLFGNLEGPLSDKGKEVGNLYSFRMSPQALAGLQFAGFDVLSLANNHIGDWGREALADTIVNLKKTGIVAVGAGENKEEAYRAKVVEIKGVKIAFLAFADFADQFKESDTRDNIAVVEENKITQAIQKARAAAEVVVVYFHFGDEYSKEINPRQQFLAHFAVDKGADLVVGSHPHVVQPLEIYKDKYIAYSLGNFVFDQNFSKETMTGGLLKVSLAGKNIVSAELYAVRINNNFQPELE